MSFSYGVSLSMREEEVLVESEVEQKYPTKEYLDSLKHEESPDCWCFPEVIFVDPVTGNGILLHHYPH